MFAVSDTTEPIRRTTKYGDAFAGVSFDVFKIYNSLQHGILLEILLILKEKTVLATNFHFIYRIQLCTYE